MFRGLLLAICLLGIGLRAVDVWRPVDGTIRDSWREPDVAGIARNFYREGMNPLYPRIDWRGDGPGFVESEFPIYPWTVACLYHVFGYHEELLRVVSFVLSLLTLALFVRIATEHLSRPAAVLAAGFFAINPLAIRMASAIQPEPLMCLGYLAGAYWFERWCRTQARRDFMLALGTTTLAILAKFPAAHIGLLFAGLCLQHFGWRAALRRELWLFGLVSLGLPLLWYWHAHSLFVEYGNSLGMSNEAYQRIASLNFLAALKETLPGIAAIELDLIWMPAGIMLGAVGLWTAARDVRQRWLAMWLIALVAYFVVTGRTTGEDWASHYHFVAVASMLMGIGASRLMDAIWQVSAAPSGLEINCDSRTQGGAPDGRLPWAGLSLPRWGGTAKGPIGQHRFLRFGLVLSTSGIALVLCALTVMHAAKRTWWDMRPHGHDELFAAAEQFRPFLPSDAVLVASGANQVDQWGLERAFNAPYFFFWTDHKGFTLGNSDQTVEKLEQLRRRGAKFLIAERRCLKVRPEFEDELKQNYRLVAEHPQAILVELIPGVLRLDAALHSSTTTRPSFSRQSN